MVIDPASRAGIHPHVYHEIRHFAISIIKWCRKRSVRAPSVPSCGANPQQFPSTAGADPADRGAQRREHQYCAGAPTPGLATKKVDGRTGWK